MCLSTLVNRSISINTKTTCAISCQVTFVLNEHSPEPLQALSTFDKWWWRMTGSNRRPPACKAGALPAELIPRCLTLDAFQRLSSEGLVGLVGLEPTTPALSTQCSNQLSYRPKPAANDSGLRHSRQRLPFQQPISVSVQFRLQFPERR